MAASHDLIDFAVIEEQKENIQSLPGGRSAKKLAQLYSPSPLHKLATPTPSGTQNVHDCIRAEYEAEISNLSESDDPLDVYDRYVRWTLDAYPSAQATPQSQLHTLLERATKAFISSPQYKNDPRYLKLWVHYIHLFSDSPRETYMFLSRHGIGEGLALFYEEYAAWLEGAGRWSQAEEVYRLGIERESRPVQRLLRKFKEFQERHAQQPAPATGPSSPALPTIRPALVAKVDPFGSSRATDPQASRQSSGAVHAACKPVRSKLSIFSDADAKPSALSARQEGSKGWDSIGSLSDRRKENTMEPKPWVGETLKAGGKKSSAPKMAVFRDPRLPQINGIVDAPSKSQVTVHPQTGKKEFIFVDLKAVYPDSDGPGSEMSLEEIMALHRGYLDRSWDEEVEYESPGVEPVDCFEGAQDMGQGMQSPFAVHEDPVLLDENGEIKGQTHPLVSKKKKTMETNETQIIKAKLDSPSGPKFRRKQSSEPTMTLHTKAATDDIYEIFNAPISTSQGGASGDDEDYETDGGESATDAESAGTTRQLDTVSVNGDDEAADSKSLSEWSEFSARKHVPDVTTEDSETSSHVSDQLHLPPLSNDDNTHIEDSSRLASTADNEQAQDDETVESRPLPQARTVFIPIPPEDYDPPTRPFRDAAEVANNRLPFMTPITERTESSVEVDYERRDTLKTPCRRDGQMIAEDGDSDCEPLTSPFREVPGPESPMPLPLPQISAALVPKTVSVSKKVTPSSLRGPIIADAQCNPVDEGIRHDILSNVQPPLSSYHGFHDHRGQACELGGEIRRFAKALSKCIKNGGEKTGPLPTPVTICFPNTSRRYTVKRELGAGAFAPVYLVENSCPQEDEENAAPISMGRGAFAVRHRSDLEALKMETPPTPWEFYIMRLVHARLGPQHRAVASLSYAQELRLYQDEAFLFLPYHPHGTLLDVVNLFRAEPSGVMDEQLAMFFSVELMRTVEALHAKGILHGDLKADNCLLRLDATSSDQPLSTQWRADGDGGWAARGVVLIDFGRGIDMKAFKPDVEFIADWKTSAQDCVEMREGRPWTWQIDYHGLAGIIHCLLFGKYIETARYDQGGLGRTGRKYKIRENLKRYWQMELWSECFEVLLNPGSFLDAEDGLRMPILRTLRSVREKMELWLAANCDRGVGLRSLMGKLEGHARARR